MVAMLSVLNRRWLANGWRALDAADAEPMALAWIELMQAARIPADAYEELYFAAIKLRARRLELGMKCDDFSAELLIACWPEVRERREREAIRSGRILPDTAASDCERCFGTGMEVVKGKGARPCDHQPA